MVEDDERVTSAPQHRYGTPTGLPCPRVVRVDGTIAGVGDCFGCGTCLQFGGLVETAPP